MVSASVVTLSGGTCVVTIPARSAWSETETSVSESFPSSCMETVRKSLRSSLYINVCECHLNSEAPLQGMSPLLSLACLGSLSI